MWPACTIHGGFSFPFLFQNTEKNRENEPVLDGWQDFSRWMKVRRKAGEKAETEGRKSCILQDKTITDSHTALFTNSWETAEIRVLIQNFGDFPENLHA